MNIEFLDLKNINNKKIIFDLSSKNNFYVQDIQFTIDYCIEDLLDLVNNHEILKKNEEGIKDYNKSVKEIVEYNKQFDFKCIVIKISKVVGFLIYQKIINNDRHVINYFLIDKEYQNKGYGKLLMNKFLDIVPKPHIIDVDIFKNEKRMIKFYNKFGFYTKDQHKLFNMNIIDFSEKHYLSSDNTIKLYKCEDVKYDDKFMEIYNNIDSDEKKQLLHQYINIMKSFNR